MLYMIVVENKERGRKTLYSDASGPVVFDTPAQAFSHMKEIFGDNTGLAFTLVSVATVPTGEFGPR